MRRLIFSVVGLLVATAAFAWGPEGHQTVGAIAELHLTAKAKAGITALIGADRHLSDNNIANWPDFIRRDVPESGPWHYVDIPFEASAYDPARDCKDGQCVISATERFLKVLADPKAKPEDRVDALKFIVHFVGDLHQPLHCIDRHEDRGGNQRTVQYPGHPKPSNLHKVWDEDLVRECVAGRSVLDYAKHLNDRVSPEQLHDWVTGTLADWAWDTHRQAVEHTYKNIPEGGPAVVLTHEYITENGHVVELRLTKAGLRLADLLNKAFAPPADQ